MVGITIETLMVYNSCCLKMVNVHKNGVTLSEPEQFGYGFMALTKMLLQSGKNLIACAPTPNRLEDHRNEVLE